MKTCKNFCHKYVLQSKKEGMKFRKEMKKQLKQLIASRKKIKSEELEKRIKIYENSFREIAKSKDSKVTKLYQDACKKGFCNPGCKGTIFEKEPGKYPLKDNFYVKTNADYLRKEGATSGCSMSKFTFI